MEILLFWMGLLFAGLGAIVILSELQAREGAVEVPGRVAGFSTRNGASNTPSYRAVVEFVGADGKTGYIISSTGSSMPLGRVGDDATVLLHPEDATRTAIKSSLSFVLGGIFCALGLSMCVFFFFLFKPNRFSIAVAAAVTLYGIFQMRGLFRKVPLSAKAWSEYKARTEGSKLFNDESKSQIAWAEPGALADAAQKAAKSRRATVPVLLLFGAGLMWLGYYLYGSTQAFLARAVSTPGQVVAIQSRRSGSNSTYSAIVEFEKDGRKVRFTDSVSSKPALYGVGDRVTVLFDPAVPSNARIDRGRWNLGLPMLIGVVGALLLFLGVYVGVQPNSTPDASIGGPA